ncbi:MAG: VOC family protein [Candidatus Roizmanbacteria bacterium]|nr:VOC family protein [Candidatus Roizmanbacteria bacterium]
MKIEHEQSVQWIILVTDHYQESRTFYHDMLGFQIAREAPEEEFCQFSLSNCLLAIYGRTYIGKLVGEEHLGQPGSAIYSFPETNDIDGDYDELVAKGVTFIKEPQTQSWGQRTAYFTDPDGHIWEIQQWVTKP